MKLIKGKNYEILFIEKSKPNLPSLEEYLQEKKDCIGFAVAGEVDGILICPNGRYTVVYSNIQKLDTARWNYCFLYFRFREDISIPDKYKVVIFRSKDEYVILQQYLLMGEVDSLWCYLFETYSEIEEDKTFCVFKVFKN